jgi:hypothetical protein
MLDELRQDLIDAIKENLSIVAEAYPVEEAGVAYEELATWFQALGICNLLLYASPERFYENLLRSGHTRTAFLRKCQAQRVASDYQMAISRWESLFDAIAAADFDGAREIVELSPDEWVRDGEYEDDFCYYLFFHTVISAGPGSDPVTLERILERFAAAAKGVPSPRLAVCQALHARDDEGFQDAFGQLLNARAATIERDAQTIVADEPSFVPRSHVFVEGLALLRMAERAGLQVEDEYRFCPSLARQPRTGPAPEDVYVEIDRYNASGAH